MTANIDALQQHSKPFTHWIADEFISASTVREINAAWPGADTPGWRVEGRFYAGKASLLFPQRLPDAAQALASDLMSPAACARLSALVGLDLLPDPWLVDGPTEPRLGGGLHEIHPGGLLGVHVDFEAHPSGLKRVANLLVYLNEDWRDEWGGALELHGKSIKTITPQGGRAVLFVTTANSWHGHPHPLACPEGRSRRSLALYYYARPTDTIPQRPKTVYVRTPKR